jgi:hypothetical protein
VKVMLDYDTFAMDPMGNVEKGAIFLGTFIGGVTFTGSLTAFAKLQVLLPRFALFARMSLTAPTHHPYTRVFSTPSRCSFPGATCSTPALPSRMWARLLDSCLLPTRLPVRSASCQPHSNHRLKISNPHPYYRSGLSGLLNYFVVCVGSPRHRFHWRRRHARRHHRAQQLQRLGLVR